MSEHQIEIRAFDGPLYTGAAEFSSFEDGYYQWQVHFQVESHIAAQYLMRRDDRVVVELEDGATIPAFVGGFQLLPDAESPMGGGHALIQLRGKADLPASVSAA